MSTATVWIDGVDVTAEAQAGSATRRLNRPSVASVTLPYDASIGGAGSRLKIAFDGNLFFHGTILMCETDCDTESGTTVYNATDPMEMWQWRPARDYDSITPGNFVDPYFTKTIALGGKQTGPQMVQSMLQASENAALIPSAAEGPLFITFGGFAGGGIDLSGIPVNWPMTIMEVVSLLTSTGEVDVILTPIDAGGNMAQVDVYNGNHGTDRSGSVIFDFGMGSRNVQGVRWSEDMTSLRNKIQYFFTPKETTRRYKANITGDDPCLPGNLGNPGGPGGSIDPADDGATHPSWLAPGQLGKLIYSSRQQYGVRMAIETFDVDSIVSKQGCVTGAPTLGCCDCPDPTRVLFRKLWQIESWASAQALEMVHVTPERDAEIATFDIGDLVGVNISPTIRGGKSGVERVYEYTISWDAEASVPALSELVTSASQEGA